MSPAKRTEAKIKKMLGSEIDFRRDAYIVCKDQPSHVRSYKVHKILGQRVPFAKAKRVEFDPQLEVVQRHRRVQKFFGENFDVDAVQHAEKFRRFSRVPQPEHVHVDKLDRFFGCKTNVQLLPNSGEYSEEDEDRGRRDRVEYNENESSDSMTLDNACNVKVDSLFVTVPFIRSE
eukprot:TRINITY_DN7968_c0_g1_i1.p1 TRINITY_DN7968_c0_g1~~TRINITY_DN7968_c0_g1_i1.p1  ORF type:complete len:175 (+),score=43.76 TRINITY_DN7968_c0_g1_i1:338-862(+)